MNSYLVVPFLETVYFLIGLNFGRAFGKKLDQEIQRSEWYKRRSKPTRWMIRRMLDFTHHWYIGALMMIYSSCPETYWFGAGLLIDDLPDIPRRIKSVLADLKKMAKENNP